MAKKLGVTLDLTQKERFFPDKIVDSKAFCKPNLVCIVARPGVGKTTIALDVVLPEAVETEGKVLLFSFEKTAEQIVSQLLMKISGANMCLMSSPFADAKKKAELYKAIAFLSELDIYVEDFEGQDKTDLSYVENSVSQFEDVAFVFIDGLYCFYPETKNEKLDEKLQAQAIAKVKTLAEKINAPILVTTYMSRADIKKAYAGKTLDNLFFKSGADQLLILYRAAFTSHELTTSATDMLIAEKSGEYKRESLCYDTKHRRFLKVAD